MSRFVAAWALYLLGDLVSRTLEPLFGHWFGWPYATYNRLMTWSNDVQGDGDGPWKHVNPDKPMYVISEFGASE